MDWCHLSTDYYDDPAVVRAGEGAELLFLRCIAYSGKQESRGRIPLASLPRLCPKSTSARRDALVRENLVTIDGTDLVIRSWEKWQERLDVEAERRRKDRERKATERSAKRAEFAHSSKDESTDRPRTNPRTVQGESTRIDREVEEEKKTASSSGRVKRGTPPPDIFPITDAMKTWGRQHAPNVTDPEAETRQFLDHHRAKGSLFKDWTAAWRTWMTNAQKFTQQRGPQPRRQLDPHNAWLENM